MNFNILIIACVTPSKVLQKRAEIFFFQIFAEKDIFYTFLLFFFYILFLYTFTVRLNRF